MVLLFSVFIYFPPEVIFRSRVMGACLVDTDCIVAMSKCENNNNNVAKLTTSYTYKLRVRPFWRRAYLIRCVRAVCVCLLLLFVYSTAECMLFLQGLPGT